MLHNNNVTQFTKNLPVTQMQLSHRMTYLLIITLAPLPTQAKSHTPYLIQFNSVWITHLYILG